MSRQSSKGKKNWQAFENFDVRLRGEIKAAGDDPKELKKLGIHLPSKPETPENLDWSDDSMGAESVCYNWQGGKMYVLKDGVYGLASEVLNFDKATEEASGSGAPTAEPVAEPAAAVEQAICAPKTSAPRKVARRHCMTQKRTKMVTKATSTIGVTAGVSKHKGVGTSDLRKFLYRSTMSQCLC